MTTEELKSRLAEIQQAHAATAQQLLRIEGAAQILAELVKQSEQADQAIDRMNNEPDIEPTT